MSAPLDPVLDGAPCGFFSFSDDGALLAANRTLHAMLGYAPGELAGGAVNVLLTSASRIFWQTHVVPLLQMHGRADEIYLVLRGKDGAALGVLANAVRHLRGGAAANDCVVVPIRERQKFEDELVRARQTADEERARATAAARAKSRFLASMSHELRTPLNAIAGHLQLVELGIHGPVTEAQRDALGRAQRAQRHLLGLVNDVLNLAKLEAGRVEYDLRAVSLAELVEDVTPMIEPQLAAEGHGFAVCVPHATPEVWADRDKLRQVLLNLLSNAIKFTPPGGHVTVAAAERADGTQPSDVVFLRVADTGVGIPPEKLELVFDPFVQLDTGYARQKEGTGLGLAISRDLARGMGGDLRVRSREGEGSTFTVTLRRAVADVEGPPADRPRGKPVALEPSAGEVPPDA